MAVYAGMRNGVKRTRSLDVNVRIPVTRQKIYTRTLYDKIIKNHPLGTVETRFMKNRRMSEWNKYFVED